MKVTEWQQTYYTGDSGIQSGATTVRGLMEDDPTDYTKKYTLTTTVTEIPAGKIQIQKLSVSTRTVPHLNYYMLCNKLLLGTVIRGLVLVISLLYCLCWWLQ